MTHRKSSFDDITIVCPKIGASESKIESTNDHAGGVVGWASTNNDISISSTTLKGISVKGKGSAGGLIGQTDNSSATVVSLDGITVTNAINETTNRDTVILSKDKRAGALVGDIGNANNNNGAFKKLSVKGVTIRGPIDVKANGEVGGTACAAGGIVGYLGKGNNSGNPTAVFDDIKISLPDSSQVSLQSPKAQVGGLAGNLNENNVITVGKVTIENLKAEGALDSGGLFGKIGKYGSLTISSLDKIDTVNVTSSNGAAGGLVGKIDTGKTIEINKNGSKTTLKNISITGSDASGGLIGIMPSNNQTKLTIEHLSIDGVKVLSKTFRAGGVIGSLNDSFSTFNATDVHAYGADSYAYGAGSGDNSAGGFAGYIGYTGTSTIDSCSASLYVASEHHSAGGFIGWMRSQGTITNCYAGGHTVVDASGTAKQAKYLDGKGLTYDSESGKVTVTSGGYNVYGYGNTGGFIGYKQVKGGTGTESSVSHCFTTASVSIDPAGAQNLAGFIATGAGNNVKNSYAAGKIFAPSGYATNKMEAFSRISLPVGNTNVNFYRKGTAPAGVVDTISNAVAKDYDQSVTPPVDEWSTIDPSQRATATVRFDGATPNSRNDICLSVPILCDDRKRYHIPR